MSGGGFIKLRRGIIRHLQDGKLTLAELGVFVALILLADKSTGIWIGSARAVAAICGSGDLSERQARHLLESLEKKGYIRRFPVRRSHANYPILVNRYEVTFGAHNGKRLNATDTRNWKIPVYEHCPEQGLEYGVQQGAEKGADDAPFLEVRYEKEKKNQPHVVSPADGPTPSDFLSVWQNERGAMPGVKDLTPERVRKIKARLAGASDPKEFLVNFRLAVRKAAASSFCVGGGWMSFDWLIANSTNMVKVLDGNYDDDRRARVDKNRDAMTGSYIPEPREQTPEQRAELERMQLENDRWDELERGKLETNVMTVEWASAKLSRLQSVKNLPRLDQRPALLANFLRKAYEAHPEAN